MSVLKKAGISAIALSLSLGLATPIADAAPPSHAKAHDKHQLKHQKKYFKDLQEAEWALKAILKMWGQGVFNGYEDGTFLPNKPITRVEAVTAAVRLMGLEDEAKARGNIDLNFRDAKEIDKHFRWAEGYIAVALENGLFDSNMDSFQPNKPATREWVATLLVRALDLEDEALAKMTMKLPFKDANQISAGAVGFVAVAVEKGLIKGYENGTFQPNKPITRAEMATLLDRMDWMNDDVISGVKGFVYMISPKMDEITVKTTKGQFVNVKIDDETYIYLNGKLISLDEVKAGYEVTVIYDEDGSVLLLDLRTDDQDDDQDDDLDKVWLSGTIEDIDLPSSKSDGKIEIDLENDEDKTFVLKNDTKVKADGLELDLTDLEVDQEVEFYVEDDEVLEIVIDGTVREVEGTIKNIVVPTSTRAGKITLTTARGDATFTLAAKVTYTHDDEEIDLEDLQVGDVVEIKTFNNVVKVIDVIEDSIDGDYEGSVESFLLPEGSKNGSLEIDLGERDVTFTLTNNTKVETDGLSLHLTDLAVNQEIEVEVSNGVITEIYINGTVKEFDGEITKLTAPTRSDSGAITLKKNNREYTYRLAPVVSYQHDDEKIDFGDLKVGDLVEITTFNAKVKVVDVIESDDDVAQAEYEGKVTGIILPTSSQRGILLLQLNNSQTVSLRITNDVKVEEAGSPIRLSAIQIGDWVEVEVEDNKVTKIEIKNEDN